MSSTKKYITVEFKGTVVLKEWLPHPNGRSYNSIMGKVTILRDEQIIGFKVNDRESNWLARVEGDARAERGALRVGFRLRLRSALAHARPSCC